MSIVAHTYPFVIGADTHSRNHALAILAPTGEVIDEQIFPTTKTWSGQGSRLGLSAHRRRP